MKSLYYSWGNRPGFSRPTLVPEPAACLTRTHELLFNCLVRSFSAVSSVYLQLWFQLFSWGLCFLNYFLWGPTRHNYTSTGIRALSLLAEPKGLWKRLSANCAGSSAGFHFSVIVGLSLNMKHCRAQWNQYTSGPNTMTVNGWAAFLQWRIQDVKGLTGPEILHLKMFSTSTGDDSEYALTNGHCSITKLSLSAFVSHTDGIINETLCLYLQQVSTFIEEKQWTLSRFTAFVCQWGWSLNDVVGVRPSKPQGHFWFMSIRVRIHAIVSRINHVFLISSECVALIRAILYCRWSPHLIKTRMQPDLRIRTWCLVIQPWTQAGLQPLQPHVWP